ncbi:superoxide dismutase family protein [Faunimonas sp. B44]|uniref:superoxide dismutase family protein n=1 Tax=Faunimonas sp. B44 TaxID=3461493 RepID=UPI0040450D6D
MIWRSWLLAAAATVLVVPAAFAQQDGATAKAVMKGADGADHGEVTLTQTPSGVLLRATLTGLPPGPHGFHFHAVGACEPPFESAGGHYNPDEKKHGFMAEEGPHAGDMPNVTADAEGNATVEILTTLVSLEKDAGNTVFDEDGTSLMVHAGPDDYATDPSGGSGDRIACGVVE